MIFLIYLSGCIMPASNVAVSATVDVTTLKTFAVWKFRDGGKVANSGDIATRAVESSLMMKGFRIIPYSKIRDIIAIEIGYREGLALDAGMLTPAVLKRIKVETGVDGIVLGSVSDAWCNPMWIPSCWIECAFQIIETNSGELIVSANISDDGWSLQSAAEQMATKMANKIKR
jgi:hypothetical protein